MQPSAAPASARSPWARLVWLISPPHLTFLDFEAALTRYARLDARAARVVELRVLSDLSMEEIAGILGVTRRTVQTDWRIATMWMRRELAEP